MLGPSSPIQKILTARRKNKIGTRSLARRSLKLLFPGPSISVPVVSGKRKNDGSLESDREDFLQDGRPLWDLQKINNVFLEADREIILSIPLGLSKNQDCLVWHFDKKKCAYTVKSGYQLVLRDKLNEAGSCPLFFRR
ncbi:hypothetical protein ACOSQ3_014495 [Xanthoceras sorbifolium]